MYHNRKPRLLWQVLLLSIVLFTESFAQTHIPRYDPVTSNCGGYYEYLPENYQRSNKKLPLLIFFHGLAESGNGKEHQLKKILNNGVPYLIDNGRFPKTFTVNNQEFSFIVLSPQFQKWPTNDDVDKVIDFALKRYKVDRKRIYLTGISMGGGVVWNYTGNKKKYAKRIAAIAPICGNSFPEKRKCDTIAKSVLPVWATHNQGDPIVPVQYTNDYISLILSYFPQQPIPIYGRYVKKTIFNQQDHDAWSATYDPAYHENGLNIYEWMLQFQRGDVTQGPLPVRLTDYQVSETPNGEAIISWTTSTEEGNDYFSVERSPDGTSFTEIARINATNESTGSRYSYLDSSPFPGDNFYRLSQTDQDGTSKQFEVKKLLRTDTRQRPMLVFPNPAGDRLIFRVIHEETGSMQVTLLNQQGIVLTKSNYQKQVATWQGQMSTAGLPAGYYILHIKGKKLDFKQSFLKK